MSTESQAERIKAKAVPPSGYQRAYPRFELSLPLVAQIIIPEETFQPQGFQGIMQDVSAVGMRIRLDELTLAFYNKLLAKTRYIRVKFLHPLTKKEIKITGRIMSIDYHKPKTEQRAGACLFGIYFDQNEGIDMTEYTSFVACIEAE
ncbi:PilZ domain-containing protein [Candidatus Sumerlaeota bacterium]|nr:PilZ domain-containing protein [Candidatus Sumerlaeota bacterium]